MLLVGMLGDDQASASSGDDADGASAAIQGIGRGAFTEVAYDQDGTIGALSQLRQGGEDLSHVLIAGYSKAPSQNGSERVQDDQNGFSA